MFLSARSAGPKGHSLCSSCSCSCCPRAAPDQKATHFVLLLLLLLLLLLVDTSKNRYSSVIRGRIGMKFGRYTRGMYTHRRSEPDFRFIVSKFLNWLISNQHKFRLISLFLVKSGWNFAVIYYGRTQINAVSRICDLVWASWLISNL